MESGRWGVLVFERPRGDTSLVNAPLHHPAKMAPSTTHQAHFSTSTRESDPVSTEYLWPAFASDYIHSQMIITLTASVCVWACSCTHQGQRQCSISKYIVSFKLCPIIKLEIWVMYLLKDLEPKNGVTGRNFHRWGHWGPEKVLVLGHTVTDR